MFACLDVHYSDPSATAACVLFDDWTSSRPAAELIESIPSVAAYEPGAFFKRELPCLLAVLKRVPQRLDAIVVDGYVDLGPNHPGLGRHLFDAVGTPVVGVAKTSFHEATHAVEVFRGGSTRPLYVTAAGMSPQVAADHVRNMAGPFRIPTLLKRVDQLCRQGTPATP